MDDNLHSHHDAAGAFPGLDTGFQLPSGAEPPPRETWLVTLALGGFIVAALAVAALLS